MKSWMIKLLGGYTAGEMDTATSVAIDRRLAGFPLDEVRGFIEASQKGDLFEVVCGGHEECMNCGDNHGSAYRARKVKNLRTGQLCQVESRWSNGCSHCGCTLW